MIDCSKIIPVREKILVKKMESDPQSGVIFLPNQPKHKYLHGIVVRVGRGVKMKNGNFRPFAVKPGDKIIFGGCAHVGGEIKNTFGEDEDYFLCEEADIFGVIEND